MKKKVRHHAGTGNLGADIRNFSHRGTECGHKYRSNLFVGGVLYFGIQLSHFRKNNGQYAKYFLLVCRNLCRRFCICKTKSKRNKG